MSIHAINAAYKAKAGSARNKAVLVALADCVNEEHVDKCFPRISTLVNKTELSERAVRAALGDLEKRGLISRNPQYHGGTKYRSANLFKLHLERMQGDGAGRAPYGAGRAPYMVQDVQGDGAPGAPQENQKDNRKERGTHNVVPFGKKKPKPAPMPDDWRPDDETKCRGRDIGLTDAEIDADLARFKTRHTRTNPGKSADWQASAREWLDKNKLAHKPVAPEAPAKFAFDGKFFAPFNSEKWRAHDEYRRRTEGRGACHVMLPQPDGSKADGWYFDTPWPPDTSAAAPQPTMATVH
jgi:hypothetical protein